ncbi:Iron hydrogenase, large subunit, C-terminal [Kalmanozyma brasiliensis GHG001]|uniref:Cytosolic Fe-S cluster assembly factor NAR1 n=1 Tax=Kalmanozyma brasiliensis (strain GHG001) TaxID=1365824 RepID=V5E5A5_KALBG|nr:Iron hydrogenase, large subunit, C-terminal [Kalmanozyma brasiliensis GHG001]EST05396.1 Iron hydrogenase, large subunit, C-terminal [Kalmanozyma brasiliensis GHG001]
MAFSGALTLTDLNDYLGPSQACIKPVEGADAPSQDQPDSSTQPLDPAASASTQIAIDHDGSYYESSSASAAGASAAGESSKPRQRTKLETAEISLNDCLACSGCVTSAESVLITMQSQEEMRRAIDEIKQSNEPKLLVASISTQSLASLSAKYTFQQQQQQSGSSTAPSTLPLRVLLLRISHFLKTVFDFDHVYDTTFARHIALKEHEREFFQRRDNSRKRAKLSSAVGNDDTQTDGATLPMLASACPGWICYAEKTHGELLPYVSTTKSPQQVAGVIAKRFLPERLGLLAGSGTTDPSPSKGPTIYHVTVMPCYDKKLEASRPDFYDDVTSTKEVDCVLTTGELDKLMLDEGFDICAAVPGEQEAMQQSLADLSLQQALTSRATDGADAVSILPHFPQLLDQPGSSSGGYLFALMRAVWLDWISENWHRFPESVRDQGVLPKLDVRIIRTADFTEYILRAPMQLGLSDDNSSSTILFRGAQCYGFRNLQNLVRKLQKQTGARNTRGAAGRLVDADGNAVGAGGRNRAGAARARARGRGGMVRRGRGGATAAAAGSAVVSKSSPLNPEADIVPAQITAAQEEEERGYDYVEVMACPSGCVNGGGQIRPPTQIEVDAAPTHIASGSTDPEGYAKGGWAADQSGRLTEHDGLEDLLSNKACSRKNAVENDSEGAEMEDGTKEKEITGWKGTSKEWVRRVEEAYWQGSRVAYTPVAVAVNGAGGVASDSGASSPTLVGSGANTPLSSSNAKSIRVEDHQRLLESLAFSEESKRTADAASLGGADKVGADSMAYADVLADLVVKELCVLAAPSDDATALDKARNGLFRTQYRAVQDEAVNGLGVQW